MAMEVLKTAAAPYQGSGVAAAKTAEPKRPEKQAASGSSKPVQNPAGHDIVKPLQPVKGEPSEENDGSLGGGNGRQAPKQLQQAVEKFKKNMMAQTEAVFGIHEGTNRVTIKIVDKDSKDVIKEYPPEQTLDMIQKVWEMAGIMVDEKG